MEEFVAMFAILIVLVPVVGLTARFTLRPIVDAIVQLRDSGRPAPPAGVENRLAELEVEVARLRRELDRVAEAEAFLRQLLDAGGPRHGATTRASGGVQQGAGLGQGGAAGRGEGQGRDPS
jgi:hypothetical protein